MTRGIRLKSAPMALPASPSGGLFAVPLTHLHADPDQPRKSFPGEGLRALGKSLAYRQEEPLVVRPDPGAPDHYRIVHGERRWRAAQLAGLATLQCRLDDHRDTEGAAHIIRQAAANAHREDLSPWDWVQTFAALRTLHGLTPAEIARQLTEAGIPWSRAHVANYLRLDHLPPWARDLLRDGRISPSHGKVLLGTKSPAALGALGHWLSGEIAAGTPPTVAALEQRLASELARLAPPPPPAPASPPAPEPPKINTAPTASAADPEPPPHPEANPAPQGTARPAPIERPAAPWGDPARFPLSSGAWDRQATPDRSDEAAPSAEPSAPRAIPAVSLERLIEIGDALAAALRNFLERHDPDPHNPTDYDATLDAWDTARCALAPDRAGSSET